MTTTSETRLTNKTTGQAGWPVETTVGELVAFARKTLGSRYHSTRVATYGGGTQVEVRAIKDGYNGRELVRKACYAIN